MNGNTDATAHDHIARTAWFCAFVLPLILAALLLGVQSANADPVESAPLAYEEEAEIEAEDAAELAREECEIAAEEAEEGEITKAEANTICMEAKAEAAASGAAGSSSTAAECPIHSATAHASTHHGQLLLAIGYTTNAPVAATIQIHGVGTFKRHLGHSGVLRFTGEEHGRPVVHIRLPASERPACASHLLVLSPR